MWSLSVCLAQVVPVPSAGEYKGEYFFMYSVMVKYVGKHGQGEEEADQ